jgi:hypothetical protein
MERPRPNYQQACKTLSKIQASGQGTYKDNIQGGDWTFLNGKLAKDAISQSDRPTYVEQLYGNPTHVWSRFAGVLVYATWCMPDGARIDAIESTRSIGFMAIFYSPEYLATKAGVLTSDRSILDSAPQWPLWLGRGLGVPKARHSDQELTVGEISTG